MRRCDLYSLRVAACVLLASFTSGFWPVGELAAQNSVDVQPTATIVYRAYGFDFGPYVDGQDPNRGTIVSAAQNATAAHLAARWIAGTCMLAHVSPLQLVG